MSDEALIALHQVRVNRRAAHVYVYADRLVITFDDDERTIPMHALERVATRRSWRGARLLLALADDEVVQVRRLSASDTSVAHRTIVGIARGLH